MYIQYEDKDRTYYCLDLFENPSDIFLLSYNWIKPKKLYQSDKKYTLDMSEEERKRQNVMQQFIFIVGYIGSKFIKVDSIVSIKINLISKILLFLMIILMDLFMINYFLRKKRKQMENKIKIDKTKMISVKYYPKTKFKKIFLIIIYPFLIIYSLRFCFDLLNTLAVDTIILTMFFIGMILLSPHQALLLCVPYYNGEKLNKSNA